MQTEAEVASFLDDAGWGEAERQALAGDFSTRRFARLTRTGSSPSKAILMMAEPDQKTESFVHIANLLRRLGVAAPAIYASDVMRGLALLEDFGDKTCGQMVDEGTERAIFDRQASAILARIHAGFSQTMLGAHKVPLFNAALFTDQATLFLNHYFPRLMRRPPTAMERSGFVEAWHTVLSPIDDLPRSLLLRDFMPDNAMVLSSPVLGEDMGVLDFQDAGIGPIAYDLASWCENCRREGGVQRLEPMIDLYLMHDGGVNKADLLRSARVLLAQRHTRFLGILTRLDKTAPMPRVWRTVTELLRDEALTPVRRWFASCSPAT